jgi:predicted AAA+ superfamily ATPase
LSRAWSECPAFGIGISTSALRGGFPEILLADSPDPAFSGMDGQLLRRDAQELFGIRNRTGFMTLLRLLLMWSGSLLEATDLAKESALSRPTVLSHIEALEIAHVIWRLPPWHGGGQRELIRRPKLYGFDTGIVCHVKGWDGIRETDRGSLWEHLVLDELRFRFPDKAVHYWRDKSGRKSIS